MMEGDKVVIEGSPLSPPSPTKENPAIGESFVILGVTLRN